MGLGHLQPTHRKRVHKVPRNGFLRKQVSGDRAHRLRTSQPGNALHGNVQAGNRRPRPLVHVLSHGLLKAPDKNNATVPGLVTS